MCDIKADFSSTCLKKEDFCDGTSDCQDGSDENEDECEKRGINKKRNLVMRELERLLQGN